MKCCPSDHGTSAKDQQQRCDLLCTFLSPENKFHELKLTGRQRKGKSEQSFYLNKNSKFLVVFAIPLCEGVKKLQTVALGVHINLQARAIWRGLLVGVLARVKSFRGQLFAERIGELELFA